MKENDESLYKAHNSELMEKVKRKAYNNTSRINQIERQMVGSLPTPHPGETVMYKMPDGPTVGELRPAIVMKVYDDQMVDLRVITDPDYDPAMGVVRMVKHGHALSHWLAKGELHVSDGNNVIAEPESIS